MACDVSPVAMFFLYNTTQFLVQATQKSNIHGCPYEGGRSGNTTVRPAKIYVSNLPSEGLTVDDVAKHFSKVPYILNTAFHMISKKMERLFYSVWLCG